ncbi:unnamed protein product [Cylicocyclus nassatus]|uniref:Uncharacterized protein n=1 Tax=Cylicocyclus nassatus TaxID=53992 RepID=A0AA36HDX7_CYLNA|nr:unnamed protein product [Cylicocyclus nassatus]
MSVWYTVVLSFTLIFVVDAQQFAQQFYNPWEVLMFLPQFPTPAPMYIDYYNSLGYETDEKGNVWQGNDNAKFMIIAKPSYP